LRCQNADAISTDILYVLTFLLLLAGNPTSHSLHRQRELVTRSKTAPPGAGGGVMMMMEV
jgi:hypothetical protein